jgi:predicted O-methyltransferase YrrM
MFQNISPAILKRMAYLEQIDRNDRSDGTTRLKRLRQIPPETGKFLAILAASSPNGQFLEIGTSAGYSALWISLACAIRNCKLRTYEILDDKFNLEIETFREANVTQYIESIHGDVLQDLANIDNISFCFLDAEKEIYEKCYDAIVPKLVTGGILVADNAINHYETLKPMIGKAFSDNRVDSLVIPIGKGELVCRRI